MLRHSKMRKYAVSIENVLLGVICVLAGAGMIYGSMSLLQRDINTSAATRVMPLISAEARRLFQDRESYAELDSQILIDAGTIPADMIDEAVSPQRIILAYGGQVDFGPGPTNNTFIAHLEWEENTRNAIALCTRLAQGNIDEEVSSGKHGFQYAITQSDCRAAQPSFEITYIRR